MEELNIDGAAHTQWNSNTLSSFVKGYVSMPDCLLTHTNTHTDDKLQSFLFIFCPLSPTNDKPVIKLSSSNLFAKENICLFIVNCFLTSRLVWFPRSRWKNRDILHHADLLQVSWETRVVNMKFQCEVFNELIGQFGCINPNSSFYWQEVTLYITVP